MFGRILATFTAPQFRLVIYLVLKSRRTILERAYGHQIKYLQKLLQNYENVDRSCIWYEHPVPPPVSAPFIKHHHQHQQQQQQQEHLSSPYLSPGWPNNHEQFPSTCGSGWRAIISAATSSEIYGVKHLDVAQS